MAVLMASDGPLYTSSAYPTTELEVLSLFVGVEIFVLPLHGKYTCRLLYVRKKSIEMYPDM